MALLWVLRTIFNSKASPGGRKGSNMEVVVRRIARDRSRSGESTRGAQQAWTPGVSPWQQLSVGLPTGPGMEWGKRVFTEGRVTIPTLKHSGSREPSISPHHAVDTKTPGRKIF